jgi:hypothetical protein
MKPSWLDSERLEVAIAILIAVVSLSTALAAWRTNVVGSSASDATRQGLIDAIKKQAGTNEDLRKLYEEAGYARNYAIYLAGVETLEASRDPAGVAQAANLRQYLLPGLRLVSSPLGTEDKYKKADGTYDLAKRLSDLAAETPDISALDSQTSFDLSDRYAAEQRLLTIGTVLLAISLFWLGLAEVGGRRLRALTIVIGGIVYLIGLFWFAGVEIAYFIMRGGVL